MSGRAFVAILGIMPFCPAFGQQPVGVLHDNYMFGPGDAFAIADFDGDGDPDVASFGFGSDGFKVSMNRGGAQGGRTGTFDPALGYPENDAERTQLAAGDVDGDGDVDAISINIFDELIVVTNQGGDQGGVEGTFDEGPQFDIDGGVFLEDPILVDIDADGDLDVVWQDEGQSAGWGLAKNQGGIQGGTEGTFGDVTIFFEEVSMYRPVPGDVDGDGDTDIVFGSRLGFASPGGDAAFMTAVNQSGAQGGTAGDFIVDFEVIGPSIKAMALARPADLDDDGDLDVVLASGFSRFATAINQGGLQGGTEGDFLVEQDFFIEPASDPRSLELADIDNDGDPDAIFVTFRTNHLLINEGVPAGKGAPLFGEPTSILENAGLDNFHLEDMDLDGDLDILFPGTRNFFTVDWNRGGRQKGETGRFTRRFPVVATSTGTNPIVGSGPRDLAMADFDGDGLVDIAAVNRDSDDVSIILNRSAQGAESDDVVFTDVQLLEIGEFPLKIEAADLEGDGDLDLIATAFDGDSASLLINRGGQQAGTPGVFAVGTVFPTNPEPFGIAAADFDEDGDTDFVVAISDTEILEYYRNQGGDQGGTEGVFVVQELETDRFITSTDCAAADIDLDGDLDIVIAGFQASFQTLLNLGGDDGGTLGEFGPARFGGAMARDVENMAIADMDGDGDPDLVFPSESEERVEIVLNPGGHQPGTVGEFPAAGFQAIRVSLPVEEDLEPFDVLALDIDGDEIPDVVAINAEAASLAVFAGTGSTAKGDPNGLFDDPYYLRLSATSGVSGIMPLESADIDGDGRPDLGFAEGSTVSGRIGVLMNDVPRFVAAYIESDSSVRVRFDEPMEPSTATVPANYGLSGLGMGTLGAVPDDVLATANPLEFVLVWNSGAMDTGEALVVEVTRDILDIDDTPVGFGFQQTVTTPPPPELDLWVLQ